MMRGYRIQQLTVFIVYPRPEPRENFDVELIDYDSHGHLVCVLLVSLGIT